MVNLLAEGFDRPRRFWVDAFAKLSEREVPGDLPRYGYVLEFHGKVVGVLLLIFTVIEDSEETTIRCNVSSWYVRPEFRAYAPLLVSRALRYRQATYFNLTPAPATVPILRAQGYKELSKGRFYSLPWLGKPVRGARIHVVDARSTIGLGISGLDARILKSHAGFGCLSLICRTSDGTFPFVFSRRRVGRVLPAALLIYCRHPDDLSACAGALGSFLAGRGIFSIVVHANGPISGLVGRYVERTPTFYRGLRPPAVGDLAFSECAMFGV